MDTDIQNAPDIIEDTPVETVENLPSEEELLESHIIA